MISEDLFFAVAMRPHVSGLRAGPTSVVCGASAGSFPFALQTCRECVQSPASIFESSTVFCVWMRNANHVVSDRGFLNWMQCCDGCGKKSALEHELPFALRWL